MKNLILTLGTLLVTSSALAGIAVSAQFETANEFHHEDVISVMVENHCKDLELVPEQGCSKFYPGQTTVALVVKDRPAGSPCAFSIYAVVTLPVSKLSCRPADVTVVEADGHEVKVSVPGFGSRR